MNKHVLPALLVMQQSEQGEVRLIKEFARETDHGLHCWLKPELPMLFPFSLSISEALRRV